MEHTFKEGDRVRVIDSRPADWREAPIWTDEMNRYAGKEGVVVEPSNGRAVRVRFEDGMYWHYKPSWLKPQEPLLKIGDRVRVLRDTPFFSAGQILTIELVDSNDLRLPYKVGGWWMGKEDVEFVAPSCVEPMRRSTPGIASIRHFFGVSNPKESAAKLPLISKTKLLTTIKLD